MASIYNTNYYFTVITNYKFFHNNYFYSIYFKQSSNFNPNTLNDNERIMSIKMLEYIKLKLKDYNNISIKYIKDIKYYKYSLFMIKQILNKFD